MPDKSFDRQNKIDFESNPYSHKIDRGIEEVEKREIENLKRIKTTPEIQSDSTASEVEKPEKALEKDVVMEQVEEYCQGRGFSEEQEKTLKEAINLVNQKGDEYDQAENLIKTKNNAALLDAFHDLVISNPEIKEKIEKEV